jgi:hypothetical protein
MANLPERHLSRLQIGQPVWVSIGSDPWRIYTGHIFSYAWIIGKLSRRALVRTDAADMLKRRLKQAGLPAHYRVDTPEHYQILLR